MFDYDLYLRRKYQAHVCRRCGYPEQAEVIEAEAEAMFQAYIVKLNKQAGIE